MRVEALLFDKDGTLFDFEASWAGWMHSAILRLSDGADTVAAALARALEFDLQEKRFAPESPVIAGTMGDIVPLMAPHLPSLGVAEIEADLERSAAATAMIPAVPLRPLLDELRGAGYTLGIATNATLAETAPHLDAAGIRDDFAFVAGCDSGFGAKPAPGMCLAFAGHLGLAPASVMMVGDSLHDLRAGRAAGMRTAGVLTGVADAEELAPFADAVLTHVGELPDWLKQMESGAETPLQ